MIDPVFYLDSAGLTQPHLGGQELILHEIAALLRPYDRVWLPFAGSCVTLAETLLSAGNHIATWNAPVGPLDALYFGTPTIVDGKLLFDSDGAGVSESFLINDKVSERNAVRTMVRYAKEHNAERIVSGLGSGDISVEERIEDMGGGEVVTMKKFDVFTDWVIVRDL